MKHAARMIALVVFWAISNQIAPASAQDETSACEILMKTAFDTESRFQSDSTYRESFRALKRIAEESSSEEEFSSSVNAMGLSGAYKMVEASFESNSGETASKSKFRNVFNSLTEEAFAKYARTSSGSVERRTFVASLANAVEGACGRAFGFRMHAKFGKDPKQFVAILRINGAPSSEIVGIAVVPENAASCHLLQPGIEISGAEQEFACSRINENEVTLQVLLDGWSRSVVIPKVFEVIPDGCITLAKIADKYNHLPGERNCAVSQWNDDYIEAITACQREGLKALEGNMRALYALNLLGLARDSGSNVTRIQLRQKADAEFERARDLYRAVGDNKWSAVWDSKIGVYDNSVGPTLPQSPPC